MSYAYAFDSDDGYTDGIINPIITDKNILGKPIVKVNEIGEGLVELLINCDNINNHFTARSNIHNRTAEYHLASIYRKELYINGNEASSNVINLDKEKNVILGKVILRFKTSDLNLKKGWPKYYYLSLSSSINYEGGENSESSQESYIKGQVLHCEEWERKRKIYNYEMGYGEINNSISYNEYESLKMGRFDNVFWPGELFVIKCLVQNSNSDYLKVTIKNTNYQTRIKLNGDGIYEGYIFDKSMYSKWYGTAPVKLEFQFKADELIDEVAVIIDGIDEYYKLHRVS